jgi:hypothetical protein
VGGNFWTTSRHIAIDINQNVNLFCCNPLRCCRGIRLGDLNELVAVARYLVPQLAVVVF